VLDQLEEIKIGVAYELDGRRLESFPADLKDLGRVEVVYETHRGWNRDISSCRTFSQLPAEAQAYVRRIEKLVGVPGACACFRSGHGMGRRRVRLMAVPPSVGVGSIAWQLNGSAWAQRETP